MKRPYLLAQLLLLVIALDGALCEAPDDDDAPTPTPSIFPIAVTDDVAEEAVRMPGEAQYQEGRSLLHNATTKANVRRAAVLLHESADVGFHAAQSLLGTMYAYGIGVPRNDAKSILFHTFAAMNGNVESNVVLTHRKFHGVGTSKQCMVAAKHAKVVADAIARGYANSHGAINGVKLGASSSSKSAKASKSSLDMHQLQADRNNPQALVLMGYAYLYGNFGLNQDAVKALDFFKKALKANEPSAYAGIGQIYAEGFPGVPRDVVKATSAFKKGADANPPSVDALNGLGYLYATGALSDDGKPDWDKAFAMFKQAADKNSAEAVYNLGVLVLNGRGTPRDIDKATTLFYKARALGSTLANYQLGNLELFRGDLKGCPNAVTLFTELFERGKWQRRLLTAYDAFSRGAYESALIDYLILAEQGGSIALHNAVYMMSTPDIADSIVYLQVGSLEDEAHATLPPTDGTMTLATDPTGLADNSAAKGVVGASDAFPLRDAVLHTLLWQSVRQGNLNAHVTLAENYLYGRGVAANSRLAELHYAKAAEAGDAEGHFKLATLYENGSPHTKQDFHLALRHYDDCARLNPHAIYLVYFSKVKMNFKWWFVHFGYMEAEDVFGPHHGFISVAPSDATTPDLLTAAPRVAEPEDSETHLDDKEWAQLSFAGQVKHQLARAGRYLDSVMPHYRGYAADSIVLGVSCVAILLLYFLRHAAA